MAGALPGKGNNKAAGRIILGKSKGERRRLGDTDI